MVEEALGDFSWIKIAVSEEGWEEPFQNVPKVLLGLVQNKSVHLVDSKNVCTHSANSPSRRLE